MIESLISTPTVRLLEQTLDFTEQRNNVLLSDIANVDTPGYLQKDLSVDAFQKSLRKAVARQRASTTDDYEPESTDTVEFIPGSSVIQTKAKETASGSVFHDRGARDIEYLMSQFADNATAHNMVTQMLKNRYDILNKAIMMKP
jgi:flagellar basal-body rod protein FlgB